MPADPGPALDLDLRDYVRVLRRRRGLISLVVVIMVGAALVYSFLQTTTYEATSQVLVTLSGGGGGGESDVATDQATELLLMQSPAVRGVVTKRLGHVPDVSIEPVEETTVVAITAQSPSARGAARDANAYAEVYIDLHRRQTSARVQRLRTQLLALDDRAAELDLALETVTGASRTALVAEQADERTEIAAERVTVTTRLDELLPASTAEGTSVVARAQVPTSPVKPATVRNVLLALFVGLFLGISAAFVREHFDDAIQDKEDVEGIEGLTVLGIVPSVKGGKDSNSDLVVSTAPDSGAAESYRTLRTSLQFLSTSHPMRTLQVTSPTAAGGKTTTVANLAVTAARSGSRVFVACCDLRRPRVHELFGLTNDVGLTSVLLGEVPLAEAVQKVPGEPRLMVLASGPPPSNPAEMLGLRQTAEILRALRSKSDLLIVDSTPVLPVTDALIVSRLVEATLVVVTAGSTTKGELRRTVELLRSVDAPLIGTVLNSHASRWGDGYGSTYSYGYGPEKPEKRSSNGSRRRRMRGRSAREDVVGMAELPQPEPLVTPSDQTARGPRSTLS